MPPDLIPHLQTAFPELWPQTTNIHERKVENIFLEMIALRYMSYENWKKKTRKGEA